MLLALIVFVAVAAPILWTVDPTALAPAQADPAALRALYWFGTDMLGRDIYSRVLYGARVSLIVGFAVAAASRRVVGMLIGVVCAGYIRLIDSRGDAGHGRADVDPVDPAGDRADGADAGQRAERDHRHHGRRDPARTRLVRGVVLSLREQPYVEAAVASGTRTPCR